MSFEFCNNCGNVLFPFSKDGISFFECKKCSLVLKASDLKNRKIKEKITHKPERAEGVVEDKNVYATYKHKCRKCGFEFAEIIDQGVHYSDEEGSLLLKCGKCGLAEQLNKKTG